jgi:hypothetical protein
LRGEAVNWGRISSEDDEIHQNEWYIKPLHPTPEPGEYVRCCTAKLNVKMPTEETSIGTGKITAAAAAVSEQPAVSERGPPPIPPPTAEGHPASAPHAGPRRTPSLPRGRSIQRSDSRSISSSPRIKEEGMDVDLVVSQLIFLNVIDFSTY